LALVATCHPLLTLSADQAALMRGAASRALAPLAGDALRRLRPVGVRLATPPSPVCSAAAEDGLILEMDDLRVPAMPAILDTLWAGDPGEGFDSSAPDAGRWASPTGRLTARGRARRLGVAMAAVLLGLLVVFGGTFAWGADALATLQGLISAPAPAVVSAAPRDPVPESVWASLAARPLRLPTLVPGVACPAMRAYRLPRASVPYGFGTELGDGPVYLSAPAILNGTVRAHRAAYYGAHGAWGAVPVIWIIDGEYRGPALLRGRQIDGNHGLAFDGGLEYPIGNAIWQVGTPHPDLHLLSGASPAAKPSWRGFVRLLASGCYAIQVDGPSFSEVIVFAVLVDG
jgi:hypothetical protein